MRQNKNILFISRVGLFAALLCLSAWLYLPFAVPVTLQSFVLFWMLGTMKPKVSLTALLVYLSLGAVGLPVFGGFQGGIGVILGPSGGFLLGFIPCALLCAPLFPKAKRISLRIAVGVLGTVILYLCGAIWYTFVYGNGDAFAVCVLPFLLPDAVKIVLAATLSEKLGRFIQ